MYPLHPEVVLLPLNLRGVSSNPLQAVGRNLGRLLLLRRAIRATHPDLLVSFLDSNNIMSLIATRGLPRIPVIISERTDPHGRSLGSIWGWLRRLTYPWADCLVTQSRHAMDFFPAPVRTKGRVIPNPVLPFPAADPSRPANPRSLVITLGRLHRVKGHDLLIEAFAQVAPAFPAWDLCIHGDGPERDSLQAMIRAHGLEGRITLRPAIADVGSRLREADLFVLPSRVEGFPNGLAEAMACGLPVISFDCASGPSELIRHGLDGLLVPPKNVAALATAMTRLMSDPIERAMLGARATEVLTRFSPATVMEQWESAIQSAVSTTRGGKQP
jgi:glycosyltransferase involved in cell wall biosynthesis